MRLFLKSLGMVTKKRVARAHHVAENNREVAALLFSKHEPVEPVSESNREGDSERQRKLARMQAIRNIQGGPDEPKTLVVSEFLLHWLGISKVLIEDSKLKCL